MDIMPIGASLRPPNRPCTLVARDGAVWFWPGIPLTTRNGGRVVPVAPETTRFWIAKLHGPEAVYSRAVMMVEQAANHLSRGEERAAQHALDRAGLDRLSPEGSAVMSTVARSLSIEGVAMPVIDRPPLWRRDDVIAVAQDFHRFGDTLAKAGPWEPSKHPRWPGGAPDSQGGRFADGDAFAASPRAQPLGMPSEPPSGMGHNGGPPLEEPPKIPAVPPATSRLRTLILKAIGKWLIKAALRGALGPIGDLYTVIDTILWIRDKLPYIEAYTDAPKTIEELRDAVKHPAKGYEIHHIIEQSAANSDADLQSKIDSADNLVRIPTLKHYEISGWYGTPNNDFGGLTPREYLKDKSAEEHEEVGRKAMVLFGMLKP